MSRNTIIFIFAIAAFHPLIKAQSLYDNNDESLYVDIDRVITTLYDVISGPPGERNWKLFLSLFHDDANMGSITFDQEGASSFRSFTPKEYIDRNGKYFVENGFYEEEVKRKVNLYGHIAQVWTSYQILTGEDGPVRLKGINAIQLVFENNMWKITNIIWQAENENFPLPLDMSEK